MMKKFFLYNSGIKNNPWFVDYSSVTTPRIKMFCFHHSGGAASFFRDWKNFLPPDIAVVAVQLPGRESRDEEPLQTNFKSIVRCIADGFCSMSQNPFVFFGHSLGGLLAYEVIRELELRKYNIPKCLIVSAKEAPHIPFNRIPLHKLSDEQFIQGLEKYQGMPNEILQYKDLMDLLLPRLRADFSLVELYKYEAGNPINCPIMVLGGKGDPTIQDGELDAWREQTTKEFNISFFPGGHFFLNTFKKQVLASIYNILKEII